jgi:hypothetical protein
MRLFDDLTRIVQSSNACHTFVRMTCHLWQSKQNSLIVVFSEDIWINCDTVELSIMNRPQESHQTDSVVLFKSICNHIEIQTNFRQRLRINANNWSIQFDYSSYSTCLFIIDQCWFLICLQDMFDYIQHQRTRIHHQQQQQQQRQQTSNFRYIDRNQLKINESTSTSNMLTKFDQWLDYFDDPLLDVSFRYLDIQYNTSYAIRSLKSMLHWSLLLLVELETISNIVIHLIWHISHFIMHWKHRSMRNMRIQLEFNLILIQQFSFMVYFK